MQIPYYIRNVYGKTTLYIADSDIARVLSVLTQKKTVTLTQLKALEELGHTIQIVMDPKFST